MFNCWASCLFGSSSSSLQSELSYGPLQILRRHPPPPFTLIDSWRSRIAVSLQKFLLQWRFLAGRSISVSTEEFAGFSMWIPAGFRPVLQQSKPDDSHSPERWRPRGGVYWLQISEAVDKRSGSMFSKTTSCKLFWSGKLAVCF